MKIDVVSGQIQGKRDYQQDAFNQRDILPSQHKMVFLADGMGGYKGGEKASELVINSFMGKVPIVQNIGELLSHFLHQSNKNITTYKKSHPDFSSMGTTLVAMYIKDDSCQWISVGDSPLYRIRDNSIQRINENHSVAGLLDLQVRNREISQKEANENPNRHMLTSALTGEELSMIDLSNPIGIKNNDIFILASDGIETLTEKDILRLVNNANGNMENAVSDILNEIEGQDKRNQDNATLIIVSISKDNSIQSTFAPQELTHQSSKKSIVIPIIISLLVMLTILIGVMIATVEEPIKLVDRSKIEDFNILNKKLISKVDSNSSYVQKINDINISECLETNRTCISEKIKELKELEKDVNNLLDREANLTKLLGGNSDSNITKLLKDMNMTLMKIDDGNFSNFDKNMTVVENKLLINTKEEILQTIKNIRKECKEKLKKNKVGTDHNRSYKKHLTDIVNAVKDINSTIGLRKKEYKLNNLMIDLNCSALKKIAKK